MTLREYLSLCGLSLRELASRWGISAQRIHQLAHRPTSPTLALMERIDWWTGGAVAQEDWPTPTKWRPPPDVTPVPLSSRALRLHRRAKRAGWVHGPDGWTQPGTLETARTAAELRARLEGRP